MESEPSPTPVPQGRTTPSDHDYDVVVVGGGINGAGIARDAAGRGLRVLLCERDDLASHTSSASSKLIHGGLRYLEHYEFRLVAKALAERELLVRSAPQLVRPLRFVMPHVPGLRPRWMMRIGLFLYDHLDIRRHKLLPGSKAVRLDQHEAGAALRPDLREGYEYSDAWVDDARLVVLTALDAAERGATILTRTACVRATRDGDRWNVQLRDAEGERSVTARALVNACGPWASSFLHDAVPGVPAQPLRLVKGSHIVVPRLFDHGFAYTLQNPDRRVVFALPFEQDFTLIGTTEVEFADDPAAATASDAEIDYLIATANRFFRRQIAATDVVHSFAGVRPLIGEETLNASAVSRDYQFEMDGNGAPLLSILGGKLTTYRKLADEAMRKLAPLLGCPAGSWTADAQLPGGDLDPRRVGQLAEGLSARYGWLDDSIRRRLAIAYGTRAFEVLGDATTTSDLGTHFGAGLYEREVAYLVAHEWARDADDVLWRRSRLGLRLTADERTILEGWLRARLASPATTLDN
ncbi:MAG: glycerol-3-phosphate dehydrogenase [Chloroflexi bacterium]|nr:glycerol-3-phosphate dehydrogenase [Chloroflexota bacterium]MDA1145878.1 glycerol-3-phosphate dehydrogenase [Chloroflexota bacterium]